MTSLGDAAEALATLDGLSSVTMSGKDLDVKVLGRHTDSTVVRAINSVPTFEIVFEDGDRAIARSGIFGSDVTIHVGPYCYSATSISKSGNSLTVEFEDDVIARLQSVNSPIKVAAGRMTHVEFVASLVKPLKWLKFKTVDSPGKYKVEKSLTPLNRGTPAGKHKAKPEGTWAAINRIGQARGWRTFIRGVDELWYVPDEYLFSKDPAYRLSEDYSWVHDIDYDVNIRKRVATMTLTAEASNYAIPPGVVVLVTDSGPTHGKWLVQDITREPVTNPTVTVTLIQPQPILPEPVPSSTGGGVSVIGANNTTSIISTNKATAVAQYAIAAGFSGPQLLTAVEVSFAEDSSHNPSERSPLNSDGSYDRGLWQVNSKAHPNYSDAEMYDPLQNAKAAYAISNRGLDWSPWTTFKNGAYTRFEVQAQNAIADAKKQNKASQATVGVGGGGKAPGETGSKKAADFLNEALSQRGKPYVLGADTPYANADPRSFDCSGLIQWAAGRVGITNIPHNAEAQYEQCLRAGNVIDVSRARHIRGALLFQAGDDPEGTYGIGHVAISMGNGTDTFEALGTGYGVNEFGDAGRFTRGALVPGMRY